MKLPSIPQIVCKFLSPLSKLQLAHCNNVGLIDIRIISSFSHFIDRLLEERLLSVQKDMSAPNDDANLFLRESLLSLDV